MVHPVERADNRIQITLARLKEISVVTIKAHLLVASSSFSHQVRLGRLAIHRRRERTEMQSAERARQTLRASERASESVLISIDNAFLLSSQ